MKNQNSNQDSTPFGLTLEKVLELRKVHGRNEITPSSFTSNLMQILKFLKDPMGLMMLGLALIYFLLGEKRDAMIMLIAFIPVSAIDVFLELRAEKALSALKATFQMTAKVFREGKLSEIAIEEIVPEDWVLLEEGQTIPADGVVRGAFNLNINEGALTGESIPIEKSDGMEVFAGTTVLSGRGHYQVTHTGRLTKFGKIVELLHETNEAKSPLQVKVNNLVKQILKITIVLVICLMFLQLMRGKSFLESLLISLTFGMASVPEEFPLVFTLYLSFGAWRLAKNGVLVKALPSVETLGSVNVICTDKTGTLTEGKFQLNEIIPFTHLSKDELWNFSLLACEPIVVDTMELAIKEKSPININFEDWKLIHDYPFEVDGKHMSHAWRNKKGEELVAMKGAVEGVLFHCAQSIEEKKQILLKTEELSSKGYRLLGLAGKNKKISGTREEDEKDLTFLGIMAFSDPIRESAKSAIEVCQQEGITVKMITGDHPLTAHAIADQLNLKHSHEALYTGADLQKMSEEQRKKAFREGAIFSRVTPEQKHSLVQTLKDDGLIVAMTGDGINDTPAMKIADIGISMGENATDAARGTAKMVLTQSDFKGIVYAITEGRRIFANLRKSFSYLISFHVPVVLLSFFPPLFKLGEVFLPIHIILLELIVHPISAFTFENLASFGEKSSRELIGKTIILTSALAGVLVSLFAMIFLFIDKNLSEESVRTLMLLTVLFGNIGFVLLETFPHFSKRLVITIGILLSVTMAIVSVSEVSHFFHLGRVELKYIMLSLFLGLFASVPSKILRQLKTPL